ncbi:MAG TPA: hypothetical protein VN643_18715 [Pyrinomonadaceae bacterium]|nr:hypothetical protein [Pyrinomonadaceae bacterium]
MSTVNKEYLAILLYLVLLVVYGVCEAIWLRKRASASFGRALLFSWLSNLLGFSLGFAILFVTVGVTLALAWDGSMERLPFKGNEAGVILVLVVLFLPALLMLLKRAFLALFSIRSGRGAWVFALLSSLTFWLLPLALTYALVKLFWRFF